VGQKVSAIPRTAPGLLPERTWDAIVIGAGPAGSVAARELALAGASVCLLDRAVFPRTKPCGYCLNSTAIRALEHVGLDHVVQVAGGMPLRRLDLAVAGRRPAEASLNLRGGTVVPRDALDSALVREAVKAGAIFCDGASARLGNWRAEGRHVEVMHAGRAYILNARIVLAADGVGGTALRDEPHLQPTVEAESYIGLAVTLPEPSLRAAEIGPGVICMTSGDGGYVGMVRSGTGELHIAAAIDPREVRRAGGPGPAAAQILTRAHRYVPAGILDARWRGTQALSRRRPVEADGVLVIGDAAGYVEPFTGEGMGWAIMSGIAVAPVALAASRGADTRGHWTSVHASIIGSRQRICRGVSRALRHPELVRSAVRCAAALPALAWPVIRSLERPPPRSLAGGGV
jgi:menaquinone-9 beta-reductase